MKKATCIVIGASAAGLACAARLKKSGIDYILLEKHNHVAHAWRNHYDRLHLHTPKSSSNLPFKKYDSSAPKYPSREQVVHYFEDYVKESGIEPVFNSALQEVKKTNSHWQVNTNNGSFEGQFILFCTGNTNIPKMVRKPGIESFSGDILHSAQYKNGTPYKDKKVLVIGFGNSACEIALCLYEHGAQPSFSVRSAVNVIPRDIMGMSVLQLGIAMSMLPPRIADTLNKPLMAMLVGDITKYGLKKLPYGPIEQIVKHHQIPLLDIGTMDLIKKGKIKVYGDIINIDNNDISFEEDKEGSFDAIIMATGYETGLESFVDISKERKEDIKLFVKNRKHLGEDNLYFCGFYVSPTGMIREFNIESNHILRSIQSKLA